MTNGIDTRFQPEPFGAGRGVGSGCQVRTGSGRSKTLFLVTCRLLTLLVCLITAVQSAAESAVITINAATHGPAINPAMYGIFLEEINHGVDGGLYAELVRNRAFEDLPYQQRSRSRER